MHGSGPDCSETPLGATTTPAGHDDARVARLASAGDSSRTWGARVSIADTKSSGDALPTMSAPVTDDSSAARPSPPTTNTRSA